MTEPVDDGRRLRADVPLLPTLASVPIQLGIVVGYADDGSPETFKRLASGSAFVVNLRDGKQFLITARHCVTGKDNDTGKPLSERLDIAPDHIAIRAPREGMDPQQFSAAGAQDSYIDLILPLMDDSGNPVWFEHEDPRVDVVAIMLPDPPEGYESPWKFTGYPIATWGSHNMLDPARPVVQAGESVSVVGHPLGLTAHVALPIWTHATIASDAAIGSGVIKTFLIDSSTTTGNSGSAVVFYRHGGLAWMKQRSGAAYQQIIDGPVVLLLGIYSARLKSSYSSKETTIGRVWKAEVLEEIIPLPHGLGRPRRPSSKSADDTTSVAQGDSLHRDLDILETVTFENFSYLSAEKLSLEESAPLRKMSEESRARLWKRIRQRRDPSAAVD